MKAETSNEKLFVYSYFVCLMSAITVGSISPLKCPLNKQISCVFLFNLTVCLLMLHVYPKPFKCVFPFEKDIYKWTNTMSIL